MRFKKLISIAAAAVMTAAAMGITALADTTTTEIYLPIEQTITKIAVTPSEDVNFSQSAIASDVIGNNTTSGFAEINCTSEKGNMADFFGNVKSSVKCMGLYPSEDTNNSSATAIGSVKAGDKVSLKVYYGLEYKGGKSANDSKGINYFNVYVLTQEQLNDIKITDKSQIKAGNTYKKLAEITPIRKEKISTVQYKTLTSVEIKDIDIKTDGYLVFEQMVDSSDNGVLAKTMLARVDVTRTTADTPVSGDVSPTSKAVYGNEESDTDGICSVGAVFDSVIVEAGKSYVWKLSNGTETAEIAVDETVFGSIQGNAKFGVIIYNVPSELADKVNVVFAPKSE
ncbi:MAG: hypothetical protein PUF72_00655 [Clostridiales bacterium]|nr:hypothetical protein [Clostridiales bacterium]